ncbi:MAG: 4Fe-4S binding protein [Syntrophomonadaceae bacterium]|nr:4Fe-4S binding protein [Syntrophomonadaceae bacterium]MDD3890119.1 4Fe-4S binding protein [Syntrophomonadaceae bacterium]MDD4549642.1 4Fe-4S binding protein [Syntrophomonadaceae bacterium]
MFVDDNCVGCGLCVESCPIEAISLCEDKAVIDKELCVECLSCIDICPFGAIHQDD